MPSPTGWQREGRLKSELSVGVFVPLERTHFLKLQGSFKTTHLIWRTCFREKKKLPVFPVRRGLYQQIKPFSHSKCCVVFVSLKLGLNRQTDLSKKIRDKFSLHPSRIIAWPSRISAKTLVFEENMSLHLSRIIARPSQISAKT